MTVVFDMLMNGEMVGTGFDYLLDGNLVRCTKSEAWGTLTLNEPDGLEYVIMPNGRIMHVPFLAEAGEYERLEPTPWTVDDLTVVGPTEKAQRNPSPGGTKRPKKAQGLHLGRKGYR